MRIIGKTNIGFLVEASEKELANCMGMQEYAHDRAAKNGDSPKFEIGVNIPVSDFFDMVREIREEKENTIKLVTGIKNLGSKVETLMGLKPFVEKTTAKN